MIIYVENTKESTKQLPELVSLLSKVERYKINIENTLFLHMSKEQLKTER